MSQGATTQSLIEQMIKDNGFSCKPEFRAFSGYPIIKSSLDAGNIDVFAMDRSTLALSLIHIYSRKEPATFHPLIGDRLK